MNGVKRVEHGLENLAKTYLPAGPARGLRMLAIRPRYFLQSSACRQGYREWGPAYSQRTLLIVGLPKSGTAWLEDMLLQHPGYGSLFIPDVARYEVENGGTNTYALPEDFFDPLQEMLAVIKLHCYGSEHNAAVLKSSKIKYLVLYRDLRDVAVSFYYFVRSRPWHPDYPLYRDLTAQEGLAVFAEQHLDKYAGWVRSWHRNRDPHMSLGLRFEDLLADPFRAFCEVCNHFELDTSPQEASRIVDLYRFQDKSSERGGQLRSQVNFRKGVSGDWKNYIVDELREIYKAKIGRFLVEFGYEEDLNW